MPLSRTGSYTKSNTIPMSQTWSTHENTYRILCHDKCTLTIPMVRTGLFECRNFVNTFSNITY
ncbi:hypothetical protein F383_33741 [Gossypium arboreum]|uniref:Uncharacterized protein n=1 Tax=Gossypium arboreum TaxID=29729 RepID=A0A0B0MXS5_GOSAR|nr:hypothetical protein F383_33741 [Gossypium arboreum]